MENVTFKMIPWSITIANFFQNFIRYTSKNKLRNKAWKQKINNGIEICILYISLYYKHFQTFVNEMLLKFKKDFLNLCVSRTNSRTEYYISGRLCKYIYDVYVNILVG